MRAIAAVVLVAGLVLGQASAASAAGVVELSSDGSTWSSSLGSPLFTTTPTLVPMSSQSATFWVRNSAADSAYLRLTVENLAWSGSNYASALTVAASVPGKTGTPLDLASSSGCVVLLDGVLVGAGQAVKVTATLALGNLEGTAGQSGTAAMDIGVLLEQATSTPPAAGCNPPVPPPTTVVVIPAAPVAPAPSVTTTPVAQPVDGVPPLIPGDSLFAVLANTLVSFDGSLVGWAAAGIPLGALFFLLARFIRRLVGVPKEPQE